MAKVSPRMHLDIERLLRAAYSLNLDKGLCEDHRSSSVPATTLRYHQRHEPERAATAPATGYGGIRGSTTRPRLMSPTKHIRIARYESKRCASGSYIAEVEHRNWIRRQGDQVPKFDHAENLEQREQKYVSGEQTLPQSTASSAPGPATIPFGGHLEMPLFCERNRLSDAGAGGNSVRCSPMTTVEGDKAGWSRKRTGTPASELGTPKKLMELIEDRDRAVHLCLQYRCKLKNTEECLRAEERLTSDLKGQLREAIAAGEATRKLFDQVMDKVRADENRKLRQEARALEDDKNKTRCAEDARKAQLQLKRARKDLRELWLERDELARLAGQAIQAEQAGCKKIKKLELVVSGLRERAAALTLSEEKKAEDRERAETRAVAAEVAERELRAAVKDIKDDFETLVHDLRSREKQIRQLEAKNATIVAVKTVATSPAPRRHIRFRQDPNPVETGKVAGYTSTLPPSTRCTTSESTINTRVTRWERRSSSIQQRAAQRVATKNGASHFAADVLHPQKRGGVCEKARIIPNTENGWSATTTATIKAAVPASIARSARTQLTPWASEVPGRVMTLSYPRCGGRATFTPVMCREPMQSAGDIQGEDTCCLDGPEEEDQVQQNEGEERNEEREDGAGLEGRYRSSEKHVGPSDTSPSSPRQPPSQDGDVGQLPSRRHYRQPAYIFSAMTPISDHATAPSPGMPAADDDSGNLEAEGEAPAVTVAALEAAAAAATVAATSTGAASAAKATDEADEGGDAEAARLAMETKVREYDDDDGHANGALAKNDPPTAQSPETCISRVILSSNDESDARTPSPRDGGGTTEEVKCELGHGPEVNPAIPLPLISDERACPGTAAFRSRLVEGVPVLKYGGGRGKPKAKMLWVTPDLSEIYYTEAGRTKNSKKSSHMPLAGLCASRGRGDCPELLRAPTDERCFALVQAADYLRDNPHDDKGGGYTKAPESNDDTDTDGGADSPVPGRRKWGIGGTLPANLAHGKRWRGGSLSAAVEAGTTGRIGASSASGSAPAAAGAAPRRPAGGRERMGLETTSAEECTALVEEINELVRLAGLKEGGGGTSSRGRDIFDEWLRSATVERDAEANVNLHVLKRPATASGLTRRLSSLGGLSDNLVATTRRGDRFKIIEPTTIKLPPALD